MILHGFLPAWGLPDISPMVTKLDCYLRMSKRKYEYQHAPPTGFQTYPQGKAPYIELDGQSIGDSSVIIEHLEKQGGGIDGHLTLEQRAQGHLLLRTMERSVYWHFVQLRWLTHFEQYLGEMSAGMGAPKEAIRPLVAPLKDLYDTMLKVDGVGRHDTAFLDKMVIADFEAAAVLLGDKPYLFNGKPSSYDATLWAFVQHVMRSPFDTPVKTALQKKTALVAYANRISEQFY